MKKLFSIFLILMMLSSLNFSQELQGKMKEERSVEQETLATETKDVDEVEEKNSLYIHPLSLWIGPVTNYYFPLYVFFTYERHLGGKTALVIKPNFKFSKTHDYNLDDNSLANYKYNAYGAQVGIRKFEVPFLGTFFEAGVDIAFYDQEWYIPKDLLDEVGLLDLENTYNEKSSALTIGPMVNFGRKMKSGPITYYLDAGVGYAATFAFTDSEVVEKKIKDEEGGFLIDINFGIGTSF